MTPRAARHCLVVTALLGAWSARGPEAWAAPPRPRPPAGKSKASAAPAPEAPALAPEVATPYRAPRPMFRWEFPPVLSEVDVPEEFETNGIPNRFRALVVALPAGQAYRFFNESFVRQGLYVAPTHHQMEMGEGQVALTGFDSEREVSYTVFLTAYDDGTTGVIMGEAYFKGRALAPGNPFVPIMAGGEGLVTQNLESGRSLVYRVKSNVPEILTFYAQVFRDRGYEKQADGTWTRGNSVLQVVAQPSNREPQSIEVGIVEFFGASPR